ncbi:MAG: GatB/YqeY domain-containing protein [Kutzneria sp.]|nr:GatB/YqeY domain-containing protein [Kutzneria sp.]MBV9843766.1 GatB/YqeY domain-containing protein [Kutzneria sp.]
MAELKARLRADLTTAMKNREATRMATLRMTLAAVTTEEVAGKVARELSDDDVLKVIIREVKKRHEAAEAFTGAGRGAQAEAELAEAEVLKAYLPAQLSDAELTGLVADAVAEVEAGTGDKPGLKQMGQVMKLVTAKAAGRAEGGRLAAAVRAALAG